MKMPIAIAIASALAAALAGCGAPGQVQPWEKGTLARADMTFSDAQPMRRFDEHVYTSREASSGGAGVGGGGCGCN